MNLTLEVVSANGSSLGAGRRKVFGAEGGRIGRATDCDWVLPSPDRYISRHHATILFKYGQFYVKAEGENGVAINSPNALVPFDEPQPIKAGDRLFIDEYEILVSVPQEASSPRIVGDPFAETGPQSLIPMDDSRDREDLDPLRGLPGAKEKPSTSGSYAALSRGDVLNDPFVPPPIVVPPKPRVSVTPAPAPPRAQAPPRVSIPSDPKAWNKTSYGLTSFQQPEPSRAADVSPPAATPESTRKSPIISPPPIPPPRPAPAALKPPNRPIPPKPPIGTPVTTSPLDRRAPPQPPPVDRRRAAQPLPVERRAPQPPPERRAPQPLPGPTGALDLAAMLRAAGVDPTNCAPETAATLGQILLIVVQGTIDALRARDEIKSQFRLAVTRVRVADNNPLTFAIDAAHALDSLLNQRNPAFLPPVEAFQRAFDDIRLHQMAMLAGMRAGFENLLERFDPEQLQEGFDKQVKRSAGLLGVGKPKYWELYADYFAHLRGDPEDAFRRLFGEEFARAYEKQAELLRRNRGKKAP
jgi:type VI secretion system FHA domain protein